MKKPKKIIDGGKEGNEKSSQLKNLSELQILVRAVSFSKA